MSELNRDDAGDDDDGGNDENDDDDDERGRDCICCIDDKRATIEPLAGVGSLVVNEL